MSGSAFGVIKQMSESGFGVSRAAIRISNRRKC
jgi:hypothetical protein